MTEVFLDTAPPRLTLSMPKTVVPPDALVVEITADEDIGAWGFMFIESSGVAVALGASMDARTLRLVVPTVGLSSGRGRLSGSVADLVGNQAIVEVGVLIDRPVSFDAALEVGHSADVIYATGYSSEAALEVGATLDVRWEMRRG